MVEKHISKKLLRELGFKYGKRNLTLFPDHPYSRFVKGNIVLFYKDAVYEYEPLSVLIGFIDKRRRQTYLITFRWIHYYKELQDFYLLLTGTSI